MKQRGHWCARSRGRWAARAGGGRLAPRCTAAGPRQRPDPGRGVRAGRSRPCAQGPCPGAVCTRALCIQMAGDGVCGGVSNWGAGCFGFLGSCSVATTPADPPGVDLAVLRTQEVDFTLTVATGSCTSWARAPQPPGSSQEKSFRERAWVGGWAALISTGRKPAVVPFLPGCLVSLRTPWVEPSETRLSRHSV